MVGTRGRGRRQSGGQGLAGKPVSSLPPSAAISEVAGSSNTEPSSTKSAMEEPPSRATVALLSAPPVANLLQSAEGEVLIQNLRGMVNDPEYSDVQFVCSNGGRVRACRLLLVARSSVLKSLLTNGMSESRLTEIPLPDITTAAMLTTVQFLYTGTMVHNQLTLVSAFQTVHAARFLMLDKCAMHILVAALKEEAMDAEFLVWCFTQFSQLDTAEKPLLDETDSGAAGLVKDMASKLEDMDTHSQHLISIWLQHSVQMKQPYP